MTESTQAVSVAKKPTHIRFLVLSWLCLLATLAYIQRGALSVPAELIQLDLGIDEAEMARIMFSFFLGYSLCQIPCGRVGDWLGNRWALTLFVISSSLATAWMGLASSVIGASAIFWGLWIGWCCNGVAQAGLFPCSVGVISNWFPEKGKAFPSGMLSSFMSVGGVISVALTGFLLEYYSWETVFVFLALPGFLVAGLFLWSFRNTPAEHPLVNDDELSLINKSESMIVSNEAASVVTTNNNESPWLTLVTSLRMWLICGQQFFRAASYIFYMTWFPKFLQTTRGVEVSESGYLTSLPLFGIIVGASIGGYLMDWIYQKTNSRGMSRKGMALLSVAGGAILVFLAYWIADPLLLTLILTLGSISAGLCGPASYTVTMDLGGQHIRTVFATMNMVGNFGAALMPLVVERVASEQGWNSAIFVVAGCYVIATICWLFLDVEGSIFPMNQKVVTA